MKGLIVTRSSAIERKCVQMPVNSQISPSTIVRLPELLVANPHLASVLLQGRKKRENFASSEVIRGTNIPAEVDMNGIDHVSTVLITLVHGTWPAGAIPRLAKHPLWFEEGSTFRTKLVTSLANKGISCQVAAFSWSGANSILGRDRAASELADYLAEKSKAHVPHFVIAHSHGGNVTLRAITYAEGALNHTPFVVTMATPFIEAKYAEIDFSVLSSKMPAAERRVLLRSYDLKFYLFGVIAWVFILFFGLLPLALTLFDTGMNSIFRATGGFTRSVSLTIWAAHIAFILAPILALSGVAGYFIVRFKSRVAQRKDKSEELVRKSKLGFVDAIRLFVIRAIDDEASLTLAFGSILNRVIPKIFLLLPFVGLAALLWSIASPIYFLFSGDRVLYNEQDVRDWCFDVYSDACGFLEMQQLEKLYAVFFAFRFSLSPLSSIVLLTGAALLFLVVLGRSVYGREMAFAPMECQISSHSSPDGINFSRVVTLPATPNRRRRHGIYDRDDCIDEIARWIDAKCFGANC